MLNPEYEDIDHKDAGSDVNDLRHFAHESSKLRIRRQQLTTEHTGFFYESTRASSKEMHRTPINGIIHFYILPQSFENSRF